MSTSDNSQLTGRVKWFNNKAGYGFITITSECDKNSMDVFVHHSSILVSNEQYKYLVQGEYVTLILSRVDDSEHEYQANNVKGVCGGKLMCETRNEAKIMRPPRRRGRDAGVRVEDNETLPDNRTRIRVRGGGPRDGNTEWMLVKRKVKSNEKKNTVPLPASETSS